MEQDAAFSQPTGKGQRTLQQFAYNARGQIIGVVDGNRNPVSYDVDSWGRITGIGFADGVKEGYAYTPGGQVCRTTDGNGNSVAYRYYGNGNRTVKSGTQAGPGGITSEMTVGNNALDISYSYDVRGQLLEERRNGASVCYTYDKAGNRLRKTDEKGAVLYRFNRKNQLIAEENNGDKNEFTYDRQGGIVEKRSYAGIRLFSYNSRHQQTKVETESGNVQENRYDSESLRFELLENGRRTGFVYHNGELLHEEGREEQKSSYHLGMGIDAFQRGQELSYCHRDEQLSMALITGEQGGIQNSYQYDAFGVQLEAVEQFHNRIRYTGQQFDNLTEQYYLRARYYNPVLGRFMQEDVYQGDGLNLYAYCGNNPVVYYDPSGYECTQQNDGGTGNDDAKQSTGEKDPTKVGEFAGDSIEASSRSQTFNAEERK